MRDALAAMNQLVAEGIVGSYAIGGAVGASFYLPAMQTEDVDVFVSLATNKSKVVSLAPVYAALGALGGKPEGQYVRFGAWPLQVLTDANPLITEAIRDAKPVTFDGIPTRVFTAKHLCAIALQTGRTKDLLRVALFLEHGAVTRKALSTLLERYDLEKPFERVAQLGRRR